MEKFFNTVLLVVGVGVARLLLGFVDPFNTLEVVMHQRFSFFSVLAAFSEFVQLVDLFLFVFIVFVFVFILIVVVVVTAFNVFSFLLIIIKLVI